MLQYSETINSPDTRKQVARAPGQGAGVVTTLARRKGLIALCALAGLGGGIAFAKFATPRYVSIAQVYVDPRGIQVIENELTPKGQDSSAAITIVESQARVMTSRSVLLRVVEMEKLYQDPEFNGQKPALLGFSVGPSAMPPREELATNAMYALVDAVSVRRPERTYIIDITVKATSGDKAARIANAVAKAYLETQSSNRTDVAQRASGLLNGRLDELRERVRIAEDRVEAYKSQNNLVGTRAQLVSEQQLSEMNLQLTTAQGRLSDAQSRYDQVQRALKNPSELGALTEAIASPTITALRNQATETNRKLAEYQSDLGDLHPTVRNIKAQANDIRRAIDEELARIVRSVRNDLERARASERAITAKMEGLKTQAVDRGQAFVKLRELERDVETSRALYQTFLTRSREVGEIERLDTSNARVITEATAPRIRSFPPRGVVAALMGLAAGLAAGLGLAFALEANGRPVLPASRLPRQPARSPAPAQPGTKSAAPHELPTTPVPAQQASARPVRLVDLDAITAPYATTPKTTVASLISRLDQSLKADKAVKSLFVPVVQEVQPDRHAGQHREQATLAFPGPVLGALPFRAPRGRRAPQNPAAIDLTSLGLPAYRNNDSTSPFAMAAKALLERIEAIPATGNTRTVAIIGPNGQLARTTISLNLALAASYAGRNVLLMDTDGADMALTGTVREAFATAPRRAGEVLRQPFHWCVNNVGLLLAPQGTLSASPRAMIEDLRQAGASCDMVVFDGPRSPAEGDASGALEMADHIILALSRQQMSSGTAARITASLGTHAAKFIGVAVLDDADSIARTPDELSVV